MLLLPVILLIMLGLWVAIRQVLRPRGVGTSWLIAVLGTLLVWGMVLAFRWLQLPPVVLGEWLTDVSPFGLEFKLDDASWTYAFSLITVALVVLMTAAARQIAQNTPLNWVRTILMVGLGLLAIFTANPLALVLAWTAIDLAELALLLTSIPNYHLNQRAVLSFAARVGGSLLLLWAQIASVNLGQVLLLSEVNPDVSLYVLLAAGLRLGVLPLHLPFSEELPVRRGWGTTLRMVSMSTSLVVLARLPANAVPVEASAILLLFAALAALYGAIMWLSTDELRGRPYWLISLAGMAVGCVIRGYPSASIAWGVAMILPGTMLFLYTARTPTLLYIMLLGLVSLSGLPFTPAAGGWAGLVVPPFNLPDIIYIIAYAMVLIGYIRNIFRPGQPLADMDRWMQTVYPFGLIWALLSTWLIAILGWPGSFSIGNWWASLVTAVIVAGGWFFLVRRISFGQEEQAIYWWKLPIIQRLGRGFAVIFRLDWAYRLLWWFYRGLQRAILIFQLLLEGDGGVLWTMVLLALLIILLQVGGSA